MRMLLFGEGKGERLKEETGKKEREKGKEERQERRKKKEEGSGGLKTLLSEAKDKGHELTS